MTKKRRFVPQQEKCHQLTPKTPNQADYIRTISENIITLCHGPSGSGKSLIAIGLASHYLKSNIIEKIFITRSLVGCGKDIGAMPGNIDDKLSPYIVPYIEYLQMFLGKTSLEHHLACGNIVMTPVELIRGHTYHDTMMIAEECQNMTAKQLKLLLSRIGKNSKLVLVGDDKQSDIHESGFKFCLEKLNGIKDVGVSTLDYGDICRNSIIAHILEVFDKYNI